MGIDSDNPRSQIAKLLDPRHNSDMSSSASPVDYAASPNFGTGRLIRRNEDGSGVIAYLDVPGAPPIEVPITRVTPTKLLDDTRVWVEPGPESPHWRAGRIGAARNPDGTYWVLLPNSKTEQISESRIWTRWEREPSDLIAMLENLVTETPHLYVNRLAAMRALVAQISHTAGLTGLWSSLVELHEHQLETARKILSDPVPRYLLADEVGLGKTIEAGLVIRQHLADDNNARVLILAPSHLINQWKNELDTKFLISDFGKNRVRIVSHDDLDAYQQNCSLVVVDEVHRLSRHTLTSNAEEANTYTRLSAVCHSAERLLLLTATPVRAQGIDYLAILNLLDPISHPLEDVEGFQQKLSMRGDIAEMLLGFSDSMPLSFVEDYVNYFRGVIPDDVELHNKLDALSSLATKGEDAAIAIRAVRSHIAQRYRLHSRMIRNRRSGRLLQQFPVRGRRLVHTEFSETMPELIKDALDGLRAFVGDLENISSFVLNSIRDVLLLLQTGHWPTMESREEAVIHLDEQLVSKCENAASADEVGAKRIAAVINFCEQLRTPRGGQHNGPKVFFSTSTTFANDLGAALGTRWGANKVVRLTTNHNHDQIQDLIETFRNLEGNSFLVCDATVEEGVNLQFADLVVLTDLPASSGSIEQRIGRFDRFSLNFEPVDFAVITSNDPVETMWFNYLLSLGIFEDSVANLQYALKERDDEILRCWLTLGHGAVSELVSSTSDFVQTEKREIAKQDVLDASEQNEEIAPFIRSLKKVDRELPESGKAILAWAGDLGFRAQGTRNEAPRIFRGLTQLNKPKRGGLLFNALVAQRLHPEQWGNQLCVDRTYALDSTNTRILGAGNPVIDAILDFTRNDERGRVCARMITLPKVRQDSPKVFADLHSLIEPDWDEIERIASDFNIDSSALRTQFRQWFPTVLVSCYLDELGNEIPEALRSIIESPYDHDNPNDLNLGGSGYETFLLLAKDLSWSEYCRRMEKRTKQICDANPEVARAITSAVLTAQNHYHDVRTVLESRIGAGLESPLALSEHETFSTVVLEALSHPKRKLDCVRVTFIKGPEG